MDAKSIIEQGLAVLGIEFGSTRIKAVLIGPDNKPIAQGSHTWENQLVDGLWTYSTSAIYYGLQDCYADLRNNVRKLYDVEIERLAAIGISAMMHGYMAFGADGNILMPFRTWRNTNTGRAAAELSELFVYNIPLRWSISHLYQAILDNEEHVAKIDFLTTLAGFIHWKLTGERVLGVGDLLLRRLEHGGAAHSLYKGLPALSHLGGPGIRAARGPNATAGLLHNGGAAAVVPVYLLQPGAG